MNSINKSLIKYCLGGVIFVSATGTIAHFLYDWTGQNPVIGLFTAVNESTWEHMKLIFFPMLLYYIFLFVKLRKKAPETIPAIIIATIIGTCMIPVLFYTYTGILGYMITAVNLGIYYVSVIVSFVIFYILSKNSKLEEVNIILCFTVTLFICMFFLFTYNPPGLGIFIDPTITENGIH